MKQYLALHPWFAFLSHGYWDCCVKAIDLSRARSFRAGHHLPKTYYKLMRVLKWRLTILTTTYCSGVAHFSILQALEILIFC
jgi:hypothetical protein